MLQLARICLVIAALAFMAFLFGFFTAEASLWKTAAIACSVAFSLGISAIPVLSGLQFTCWIIAALVAAMLYPSMFLQIGPFDLGSLHFSAIDLRNKWLILLIVQLVMFGMGTKMSLRDFAGVIKMPYPILVGLCLQFVVMPLTGYALAKLFNFPAEIAAGVVLIGSCSSGLASNVMCYLAGANLALSISLTAIATLLAPIATPFWMKQLAGEFVEVDGANMAMQIVRIVIVPIGAALLHDYLSTVPQAKKFKVIACCIGIASGLLGIGIAASQADATSPFAFSTMTVESLFILSGAIFFALCFHAGTMRFAWLKQQMHVLSMFGIIYFTLITTAAGRDNLLVAGVALLMAAVLHNTIGYVLGYALSRSVGLDKESALTVAFEVGMQNGGMASGLAGLMGKLGTVGLAAAVFSPWMNISGSVLANLVRRLKLTQTQNTTK